MSDIFTSYETGLTRLLKCLGSDHPCCSEALTLQSRFLHNIAEVRRFGDTDTRRAERAQILEQLNRLAMGTTGMSFNEMCPPVPPPVPPPVSPPVPEPKPASKVGLRFIPVSVAVVFIGLLAWITLGPLRPLIWETPPVIQEFVVHRDDGTTEMFAPGAVVRIPENALWRVEVVVDQVGVSCTWFSHEGRPLPSEECTASYRPPREGDQAALSVMVESPRKTRQSFAGLHIQIVRTQP